MTAIHRFLFSLVVFIGLAAPGVAADKGVSATPVFTSSTTRVQNECHYARPAENMPDAVQGVWTCPDFGGFQALVSVQSGHACLSIQRSDLPLTQYVTRPPPIACDNEDDLVFRGFEWRLANGRPFAVIVRGTEWKVEQNLKNRLSRGLVIRGLSGFEFLQEFVYPKREREAEKVARERADAAYLSTLKQKKLR